MSACSLFFFFFVFHLIFVIVSRCLFLALVDGQLQIIRWATRGLSCITGMANGSKANKRAGDKRQVSRSAAVYCCMAG